MPPTRCAAALALAAALAAPGCATVRQLTALRQVEFSIDRVAGVVLAGVALDHVRSFADLDLRDAGRLAAAVARRQVPLEFALHVRGENPAENPVTARMLRLTWTLALNGRETVSGTIDTTYTFPPGEPQDVAVSVRLDLYEFFQARGRDAFELALGLLGAGARPTEVSLRAVPVIDTPLGAIHYPSAITIVRRTVGGP
jgi:hypothetical protein